MVTEGDWLSIKHLERSDTGLLSVLVHPAMLDAQTIEPVDSRQTLQHGDRTNRSRDKASIRQRCDGTQTLYGPARLGIENVGISSAVDVDASFVVTAGRQ